STSGPPAPTCSPLKSIGASSFSPSPITTTPSMTTVSSIARIASTAAWSAAILSPRPIQRPAPIAAASVTRTSSSARFRSGRGWVTGGDPRGVGCGSSWRSGRAAGAPTPPTPWRRGAGGSHNSASRSSRPRYLRPAVAHRSDVGGYDAADAVTYVWLAQALIMTVYIFGWQELATRIRDGSIATDLSRPLDPQRYWLAFDLGRAPYHLIFRGVLPFIVGALVFELNYPSPLDLAAFVVSLTLAVVVSLGFRFLY